MSYLALARRYRPGDFDNILSQHHITSTLKNAVASGRISHAYLFCGPRGTGKTTTARVLAKALNCEKGPTPNPCGECTVCKEITQGSSPDIFEIDAASNRGIDDIRELRENVRYAPIGGRYKIYIIDEVHRLTKEAFDALLKTLEEPPAHVIFIFATTEPQALPPTIVSRTQRYDFKRIPISALAESVNMVAKKEGLTIDPDSALLVAKKADGSLRDALSLLDQLSSFSETRIDSRKTAEILGLVKTELLYEISGSIIHQDAKWALESFGEFVKSGGDPQELAEALTGYIRTLLLIKNEVTDIELLELDKTEIENARELVADIDSVDLLRYFTLLADYKAVVKQGLDPLFSFEAALVKMSSMDRAVTLESILKTVSTGSGSSRPQTPVYRDDVSKMNNPQLSNTIPQPPPNVGTEYEISNESNDISPPEYAGPLTIDTIRSGWKGFCRFVSRRDKTIFAHLSLCTPTAFENGLLTISVNSHVKYQHEQLSKRNKIASLESSLKEYFSSDIKVKLVRGDTQPDRSGIVPDYRSPDDMFNGSPAMRKLFDLMDGEIIGQ